jgi:hypothetical protein
MKRILALLLSLTIPLFSASIYVDPSIGDDDNAGTSTSLPKRTLHGAFAGASPGDVIQMRGGVYRYPGANPGDFPPGHPSANCAQFTDATAAGNYLRSVAYIGVNGTAAAPIKVEPFPGEKPIIKGSIRVPNAPPNDPQTWSLASPGADGIDPGDEGQIWKLTNWQTNSGELFNPNWPATINFNASAGSDVLSAQGGGPHLVAVGTIVQVSSSGTLPLPLVANTNYYVASISPTEDSDFSLSTTLGGSPIVLSGAGTGIHSLKAWSSSFSNPQQVFVSESEKVDGVSLKQINWPRYPSAYHPNWIPKPAYGTPQADNIYYGGMNGLITDMVPGSFFYNEVINPSGADTSTIYVWLPNGENPNKKVMEVSTSSTLLYTSTAANYIHLKGLTFRHSNGFAGGEGLMFMVGLNENCTLEDCDIQWGDSIGVTLHANGKLLRCNISNIGITGFRIGKSSVVDGCLISGNNYRNFSDLWGCGGSKIIGINPERHHGLLIQNCEFVNNHGPSLWFDYMDARTADAPYTIIRHNYFHDNQPLLKTHSAYPNGVRTGNPALFLECSAKFRVYDNVFLRNSRHDFAIDSSQDVEVYNNIFLGADTLGVPGGDDYTFPVTMIAGTRHEEYADENGDPVVPGTVLKKLKNVHFHHNVIAHTGDTGFFGVHMYQMFKNGHVSGLVTVVEGNTSDYNSYWQRNQTPRFFEWRTFSDWQSFSGYDANSTVGDPEARIQELLGAFVEADPPGSHLGGAALQGCNDYGVEVGQYPFQAMQFKPAQEGWYRLLRGTNHTMAGNVEIAYDDLAGDHMTARFQFTFASNNGARNLIQESFSVSPDVAVPIIDRVMLVGGTWGEIYVRVRRPAAAPIHITFTTPTAGALLIQPPKFQSGTATITTTGAPSGKFKVTTSTAHNFSAKDPTNTIYISAVWLFGLPDSFRMDGGYGQMTAQSPTDSAATEFYLPLPAAGPSSIPSATCSYFHDAIQNAWEPPAIGSIYQQEKTLVFSTNGIKSTQGFGHKTGTTPFDPVGVAIPEFIGQHFYNLTTGEMWIATGHNPTDWQPVARLGAPASFPSLQLGSGTQGAPAINFGGNEDGNTGIFQPGVNSVGISVDGSLVAKFDSHGIEVEAGTQEFPGYSFDDSGDSGIYLNSTGPATIGISTDGDERVLIGASGVRINGGVAIKKVFSVSSNVSFTSISTLTNQTQTVSITGVSPGDAVILNPTANTNARVSYSAWVSGSNTVTVQAANASAESASAHTPTFLITVISLSQPNP